MGMSLPVITSDILSSTGIAHAGVSTRLGGASLQPFGMNLSFKVGDDPSSVEENRKRFLAFFSGSPEHLVTAGQVHGNVVQPVSTAGHVPECDGLVTDVPGIFLGISVADCVPVLMVDTQHRVVAAVHAGWRGTSLKIVQQAVEVMKKKFGTDPANITAFIGPAASVCCYSVGEEVANVFDSSVVLAREGKLFVDLKSANQRLLLSSGVSADRIEISPHCTISDPHLFHSFRRDKEKSGRMLAVISLIVSQERG